MTELNVKKLYTGKRVLENKKIIIKDGKIDKIQESYEKSDLIAIPGFIDMHNHGGYGIEYMFADKKELDYLQKMQTKEGITSMLATLGGNNINNMEKAIVNLSDYIESQDQKRSQLLGINLEGPFLSQKHLGVMSKDSIKNIDVSLIDNWMDKSNDNIRLVTVAPELDKSDELIKYLYDRGVIISAGHSDASSYDINRAISFGLTQVTHMFNAMRPLHHRELGILGEALTNDYLYAEMAGCDGLSIDPKIWKMAFKLKTAEKMILTTDALTLKGLDDGVYEYNGRTVEFLDGFAYTDYNGGDRLPGKPMSFIDSAKNVMKYTGATIEDIVTMSSINPAKRLEIDHKKGYLEVGYDADINLIDEDFKLINTYVSGREIKD